MVGCAKEPRRTAAVRTVANTNLISVGWMGEWPVPRFPAGNRIRSNGRDRKPVLVIFVVGGEDHFEQLDLRKRYGNEEGRRA